jgi:hypothetical protein
MVVVLGLTASRNSWTVHGKHACVATADAHLTCTPVSHIMLQLGYDFYSHILPLCSSHACYQQRGAAGRQHLHPSFCRGRRLSATSWCRPSHVRAFWAAYAAWRASAPRVAPWWSFTG